jgi:ParB family chromosome partitioning protein
MVAETVQTAELVPVDQISVVNPRVRNRKVFDQIVENIAELGLRA